jgi:TnpA family transposase
VPRRTILTERQRQLLFRLPDDAPTLLRHYVLSDEDLDRIRRRRGPRNRLGFALQLCALRYPGRLLQPSETIPEPMLAFVAAQLGLAGDDLLGSATALVRQPDTSTRPCCSSFTATALSRDGPVRR